MANANFQIDVTTPQYLKMDHNSLKGLFGKFNPSSGDLVLSKSGELLGVMANNNYCAIIRNFEPAATFRFRPGRTQPADRPNPGRALHRPHRLAFQVAVVGIWWISPMRHA
jgi:hypothetical protein